MSCLLNAPHTHPTRFLCGSCFQGFPLAYAWEGTMRGEYGRWDLCASCAVREARAITFYVMAGLLVPS